MYFRKAKFILYVYILEKQSSLLKLLFMPSYTSFNILSHSKWRCDGSVRNLASLNIISFYKKELLKK